MPLDHHFLKTVRTLMPNAVWSKADGFDIATTPKGTYIVSNLSDWPRMRQLDGTPMLFSDLPRGSPHPMGRWFLGSGGLRLMAGGRATETVYRFDKALEPPCRAGCAWCAWGGFGTDATN